MVAQGKDLVPIPGTKRRKYLEENVAAMKVELSPAELEEIAQQIPASAVAGQRYPEAHMKVINR